MPYVDIFEEMAREEALEEGREQFRGALLSTVRRLFGESPDALPERLALIHDNTVLRKVHQAMLDSATLADFEAALDSLGI